MDAMSMLSKAWDADVERVSNSSTKKEAGRTESIKFEQSTSVGTLRGVTQLLEKVVVDQGDEICAVVYGIMPSYMKF